MQNQRRAFLIGAAAASAALPQTPPPREKLDSEKFRDAVTAGDLEAVTRYLDRDRALIYARDGRGNSVFTLAALAGQTKVCEEFVRRGLTPDVYEAAASGDTKRVTELLETAPGLVRARSADVRTPLHYAAAGGHNVMVLLLQIRGADLNAGPEPPLIAAIDRPQLDVAAEIAQTLVGNGAHPHAQRADGATALDIARARGNEEVARLIIRKTTEDHYALRHSQNLRGQPINREDPKDLPQEFINHFVVLAHTNLDEIKRLLKLCPALLMARASFDEMAIEAGAHMGFLDMADHLASLGAPVSTCTATVLGMTGFVKQLIATDPACVRERGAHDFPLLYYTAFGKERVETAELLLESGADPNANLTGQTTLHLAAQKGYVELARLLLDHGADSRATTRRGATPQAIAEKAGHSKMVELLRR